MSFLLVRRTLDENICFVLPEIQLVPGTRTSDFFTPEHHKSFSPFDFIFSTYRRIKRRTTIGLDWSLIKKERGGGGNAGTSTNSSSMNST